MKRCYQGSCPARRCLVTGKWMPAGLHFHPVK